MLTKTEIEDLKRHSGVLSIYASRVQLKKDGAEYKGLCPLHSEATPSFRVSNHQGIWVWKCFGMCGIGGDIISFVSKVDGLSFKDAVEKIQSETGNSFADTKKADSTFSSLSEPTKAIVYSLEEYRKYENSLMGNKDGLSFLKNRGIDIETIQKFHIGYREDIGKLHSTRNETGWIAFPAIERDRVVAIKYRNIGDKLFTKQPGMAKGDQTPLFNSETIDPLEPVYLVEGEIDCLTMEQAGFKSVSIQSASTPLTAANKEKLLEADYIILAGDNDPTGNEYMNKLWSELQERTYKLTWPLKDANQVFLETCKGDIESFQKLVNSLTEQAKSNLIPGVSDLRESLKNSQRINLEDHPFRWRWPWDGMDKMANIMPGAVVYLSSTNTGMGKTSLMMEASIFNALRGEVIINYSGELSNQEYAELVVAHLLKKDKHKLTQEDYNQAYKIMAGTRYYIGRNNDLSKVMDVMDLIEAAIRRSGAGTVILDTIHFVCTHEQDTIKAQENAMKRAKTLAQKYGVKWFNLGQPRKATQAFKGKSIHITDAKGSEMLTSASDVALAIHRDCAIIDDPSKPPKDPYQPLCQIILQKGRSLGTGYSYSELMFNGDICTFFPVTNEPKEGLFT